jgi:predicted HAD superfamily Cof-like phosphohydrolase
MPYQDCGRPPVTSTAMTASSPVQMVAEFHRAFGLPVRDEPDIDIPTAEAELRIRLIHEEVVEVETAIANRDIANLAGELADLVYVVIGTALQYGIPFDQVFAEVHRANMSKLGPDGTPLLREDGKIIKPFGFKPADLSAVLDGSQLNHRRMVNSNNSPSPAHRDPAGQRRPIHFREN